MKKRWKKYDKSELWLEIKQLIETYSYLDGDCKYYISIESFCSFYSIKISEV